MYKIQKKTLRKRKDSQKANKKHADQSRKLEGNNLSQRLTIPPQFFRTGVAASTSNVGKEPKEGKDSYLVDNFHGLFDKCLNIRRSERILKRSAQKTNNNVIVGVNEQENLSNSSDEIHKCLKLNSYENHDILNQHNRDERKSKHSLKRSKSIFDEINNLYTRSSQKFKRLLNNTSPENDCNLKFCGSLFKQINRNVAFSPKILLACKSKIFSEIRKLENILSGKVKMELNRPNQYRAYYFEQEENVADHSNWQYFTSSEWVYLTPEKQKIAPIKVEYNNLYQPAIMYTTNKRTEVFELKSNVHDLSNFEGRNDIVYNKKIMNHLLTVNNINEEMDVDMGPCSSTSMFANSLGGQKAAASCDNTFNFTQTKRQIDFMNIFGRPKHPVKESLEYSGAKRKLEEDVSLSCLKAQHERNMSLESRSDVKKRLRMSADAFQLNIPKFKLDQPDFPQGDDGNGVSFMEPDSVFGFDFHNVPCCSKNQMGF